MILLIDNYDSFSYNLVQLIGGICKEKENEIEENIKKEKIKGEDIEKEKIKSENIKSEKDKKTIEEKNTIKIVRNDELKTEEILRLNPSHIILSPGPGRPSEAGICEEIIKTCKGKIPILGVCLGHQAICEVFGAEITYAKTLMHGKQSMVKLDTNDILFQNLPEQVLAARYHSLAANRETFPKELVITAATEDGEIMAVRHIDFPIYGLQFHPESVLTPNGKEMIENFLRQTS